MNYTEVMIKVLIHSYHLYLKKNTNGENKTDQFKEDKTIITIENNLYKKKEEN